MALDLYMRNPASPPGKTSSEVIDLSAVLNRINDAGSAGHLVAYRNPNGVYMKMMNFRRFDPAAIAKGQVGLTRGGKDEERVWEEYACELPRLRLVAKAIREAIASGSKIDVTAEPEVAEAREGRVLTSLHRRRERSRELVEAKKREALRSHGTLACEACGFEFGKRYGSRGEGYVEVHHTQPLHTLSHPGKTRLTDLALLCANCHRMVHVKSPWLRMEELLALTRPEE